MNSPSPENYAETLSTLRYASSASQIKTKASVNLDPTAELIASLRQEIKTLKQALNGTSHANGHVAVESPIKQSSVAQLQEIQACSGGVEERIAEARPETTVGESQSEATERDEFSKKYEKFRILGQRQGQGAPVSVKCRSFTLLGTADDTQQTAAASPYLLSLHRYPDEKYKLILPEGQELSLGSDEGLLEVGQLDVCCCCALSMAEDKQTGLGSGLGLGLGVLERHCKLVHLPSVDSEGKKRRGGIFLYRLAHDALLTVNGRGLTAEEGGVFAGNDIEEGVVGFELRANDLLSIGHGAFTFVLGFPV